jgi:hypothetical protein
VDLRNTTGWNHLWVYEVLRFCCDSVEYPFERVRSVHASLAHKCVYRGWAYLDERKIRIKLNPLNRYPVDAGTHRGLPPMALADPIEVFILVAAHEIAHLERHERIGRDLERRGKRDTTLERSVEWFGRQAVKEFRRDREALLARWGDSGPGPVRPATVWQQRCPRCGHTWQKARRPGPASCRGCFGSFAQAKAADALLVIEKVPA